MGSIPVGSMWIDLGPLSDRLATIARARDGQKTSFLSTKNWSVGASTHFVGCCAEACVAVYTRLRMNATLHVQGDAGYDFVVDDHTYDVKAATFWASPDLKEFPNKQKHPDRYILVAVRSGRFARVVGWASHAQVITAPLVDYGHGPMHSLTVDDLTALTQNTLPPDVPRADPAFVKKFEVSEAVIAAYEVARKSSFQSRVKSILKARVES